MTTAKSILDKHAASTTNKVNAKGRNESRGTTKKEVVQAVSSAVEEINKESRKEEIKKAAEKINRKPLASTTTKEEKTMASKSDSKATPKTAAKKPETKKTVVKASTPAPVKSTKSTQTPLEKARAARPTNSLGHTLGCMSAELDDLILGGKSTKASLEAFLVKKHGLKEKPATYRIKSHLEHLENDKKCKLTINKGGVITCVVPK